MPSHTKDMTQGNPTKLILQFSLPLLAATFCSSCTTWWTPWWWAVPKG